VYHETYDYEWVENYEWIGIVHDHDVKPKVVLITPLAFYDQSGIWQAVSEKDRNQYFLIMGKLLALGIFLTIKSTNYAASSLSAIYRLLLQIILATRIPDTLFI
jgi:hypothetical protein